MKSLLFICTGNYYRSRIAEILFNHYAALLNIPWHADSRGLTVQSELKGLSHHARKYLEEHNIELPADALRNPIAISVDDFTKYDKVVLLNKSEHLQIIESRYSWMVKALQKEERLGMWNVHDIQQTVHPFLKWVGLKKDRVGQPEESAMEHIDFGVRALVRELDTV